MGGYDECYEAPFSAVAMPMDQQTQNRVGQSFQNLINIGRRVEFTVYFGPTGTYCKSNHKIYVREEGSDRYYGIQLGFMDIDPGAQCVIPRCFESTDLELQRDLSDMGTFQGTGQELYEKVIVVMEAFGNYNKFVNNSLDFAKVFLRSLGIYTAIPSTSGRFWIWLKGIGRKLSGHDNYPQQETV